MNADGPAAADPNRPGTVAKVVEPPARPAPRKTTGTVETKTGRRT